MARPEIDIFAPRKGGPSVADIDIFSRRGASNRFAKYGKYKGGMADLIEREFEVTIVPKMREACESVYENSVTILRSSNGYGKTHTAARLALAWHLIYSNSEVYTGAAPPESNLSGLLWGEMGRQIRQQPELFKKSQLKYLNILDTSREARIKGQPIPKQGTDEERMTSWSGKHAPYLFFIIDEGDGVPDVIFDAIMTCMSGGSDDNAAMERLLVMFNPKYPAGRVYDLIRQKKAHVIDLDAFSHPNVVEGRTVISGCVTRDKVVERIFEWTREPSVHEDPSDRKLMRKAFRVPDFLDGHYYTRQDGHKTRPLVAGEWRIISTSLFSHSVLARYPHQSAGRLFSDDWIAAARARYDQHYAEFGSAPPVGIRPVMGLDPAGDKEGDLTSICIRHGSFVTPFHQKDGLDTSHLAAWALRLFHDEGCSKVFVDSIGIGLGVYNNMKNGVTYVDRDGLRVVEPGVGSKARECSVSTGAPKNKDGSFRILRDYLAWLVMLWMKHEPSLGIYSTAMIPPDENLIKTLRILEIWQNKSGQYEVTDKDTIRGLLKESPNEFDALAATFSPSIGARTASVRGSTFQVPM